MASLIIQLRFIEIYVFTAVAALPVAVITSSNHEVSVIGYGKGVMRIPKRIPATIPTEK